MARKHVWIGLGATLALLVVLALAAVATVWWAVQSTSGTAWLATFVPRLTIVGQKGSLVGDFSAERIEIGFPRYSRACTDTKSKLWRAGCIAAARSTGPVLSRTMPRNRG